MNQFDEQQMRVHVPILGWMLIISNAMFLLLAGFLWILLVGVGVATGEPDARAILSIVGTALAIFFSVLSVPGIAAGIGLLRRKTWGRVLAIVMSILGLLNFPIGTIIGAYALWVLFQNAAQTYFAERPAAVATE